MAESNQNFSVTQGDDLAFDILLANPDGSPMSSDDLSGISEVTWQYGPLLATGPGTVDHSKTLEDSLSLIETEIDEVTWQAVRVLMSRVETAALSGLRGKNTYFHECKIVLNGQLQTTSTGQFVVKPQLSPPTA